MQDGAFGTDVLHIPGTNGIGPNYAGIPAFYVTGINNMGNADVVQEVFRVHARGVAFVEAPIRVQ